MADWVTPDDADRISRMMPRFIFAAFALFACLACPLAQSQTDAGPPEIASGYADKPLARAKRFMVVSANPLATRAGYEVLREGGSAVDAAIATQLVLNLVEPQSSGIGGGAFIVHFDAAKKALAAYDGRETAPAAARPERFLGADGTPIGFGEAINNGRSVGVPGLLRMLELAHRQHGKLPWARLFAPAIDLAQSGFAISPRLALQIAGDPFLKSNAAARAYFFDAQGRPLAAGTLLRNPALAEVLRAVAARGAEAFYRGDIARDIVAAVRSHPRPGDMTEADMAAYVAKTRPALCGPYRDYTLCGVPPPSSGAITVLSLLGVLERFDMAALRPDSAAAVHVFAEAGRLAYADRDAYVADPDFVSVPVAGMLDRGYLAQRSALIRPQSSMGHASAGKPAGASALAPDETSELAATSHLSVIDAAGNAVAMTTTIESQFGSRIMVRGFLLNNEMTDFSFAPAINGTPVANRVEGGKRPRSSMAPTLVFGTDGRLRMAVGSPGGNAIINYVAKTLVGVLDWKLDMQQAAALPNMGSRNRATELERGSALERLAPALRAMGHEVQIGDAASGVHGIVVDKEGLQGGADPRREGTALGD
jgi:gamma-glutamyltranspeptidase/glutathione hydrolase